MKCKNCGSDLKGNELFCKQCGQKIEQIKSEYNESNIGNEQIKNIAKDEPKTTQEAWQYKNNYNGNDFSVAKIIVLGLICLGLGIMFGRIIFNEKDKTKEDKLAVNSMLVSNDEQNKNTDKKEEKTENNTSTNNKNNNSTQISTDKLKNTSYINLLGGGQVKFNIANTLKEDTQYSDAENRCLIKKEQNEETELFDIWISEDYGSSEEYLEDIMKEVKNAKESDDFDKVETTNIKSLTVNNKEFKYIIVTITKSNYQYKEAYICYELSNESLYTVEISDYSSVTEEELRQLLTIQVSN